jgi:hypothetical protein
MLALMLDSKFKSMQFITSYLGHENAYTLVVQYDEQLMLPLLIQCYKV